MLVSRGRCQTHARQADQGTRGTAHARGYDAAWARYSRQFRIAHPVCGERADGSMDARYSRCLQEHVTSASACVDHIVPMSQGGAKMDPANHIALCLACNTWKASTIERQAAHA